MEALPKALADQPVQWPLSLAGAPTEKNLELDIHRQAARGAYTTSWLRQWNEYACEWLTNRVVPKRSIKSLGIFLKNLCKIVS